MNKAVLTKVIVVLIVSLAVVGIGKASATIINADKNGNNIFQWAITKFKQALTETEIVTQQDLTPSGNRVTTPKKSTKPVNAEPTTLINIPNSSPQLLPLTPPTPQGDTQPPVFENITGPADGSTIDFNSFCFSLIVKDNVSTGITVRYSFDNSGVGDWNQNYAPCYSNVSNGFHFFVVQARDAVGNTSGFISRNFTVQVN